MPFSRRQFLATAAAAYAQTPARGRPNIVFVMADSHRFDAIGCAGDTSIRTPHMDRLSAEGVRFSHTYCQAPLCQPSALDHDGPIRKMYTIQIKTNAEQWRNSVALSWSAAGQAPARVTLEKKGGEWVFRTGGRSILMRWDGTAPEMISGTK